jgi:hypothetical protein
LTGFDNCKVVVELLDRLKVLLIPKILRIESFF